MELNEPPGTIAEFRNEEIRVQLNTKMSLHHLGLQDLLAILQLLDISPPNIYLVGIQSYSITAGIDLSEEMKTAIKPLLALVIRTLESWGVTAYSKIKQPT